MCIRDYATFTCSTTSISVRIDITKKQYMTQLRHVHFVQAYISLYQPDFTGMNYSMTHQEYQQHMFPATTTGRRVSLDCRNTETSTVFINWHI